MWTYGIQLWDSASKSNINILERFQSKVLRNIVNAPWFVTNEIISNDLQISSIDKEIKNYHSRYMDRLKTHPNQLIETLFQPTVRNSRLKIYKVL